MGKIKDTKKDFKNLKKTCVVCGKEIDIKLFPDRHYRGGHFFFKIPSEKGVLEYWECESCYK